MEHDFFFLEQPVKSADVYLIRWILHDWPNTYAFKILRALVPALNEAWRKTMHFRIGLAGAVSSSPSDEGAP